MVIIAVFAAALFMPTARTSSVLYHKALVHEDSITGQVTPSDEWCNPLACSLLCNRKSGCNAFYKSEDNHCTLVEYMSARALVQTSTLSTKGREVYYASPSSVERTAHFLIFHEDGSIQDFSEDPVTSPPIMTYPNYHPKIARRSTFVLDPNMTLTLTEKSGGTAMFRWSFDNRPIEALSSVAPNHGTFASFASQNNLLHIVGGTVGERLMSIYRDGVFTNVAPAPMRLRDTCSTFVPDDNYYIYLIGGRDTLDTSVSTNNVWKYDILKDSSTLITQVPTPNNQGLIEHGCAGARDGNFGRVLVLVGGKHGVYENPTFATARLYNIEENKWYTLPSYPEPVFGATVVHWKGYIYAFGGAGSSINLASEVWKISPSKNSKWTFVGNMASESNHAMVVPYNP